MPPFTLKLLPLELTWNEPRASSKQLDFHGILWGEGEDDVVDSKEPGSAGGWTWPDAWGQRGTAVSATPHPQAPPSCLSTGGSATVSPLLVYLAFILENSQLPHTQYLDSLSKLLDYATLSVKCIEPVATGITL